MAENIGQHLIKSVSVTVGGNELSHIDGAGNSIIIHEGGSEKDCHFCPNKKNMSVRDFQYYYGTYHKYTKYDPFYECGVWEASQGKDGLKIDSLSDEYIKLRNMITRERL